MIKVLVVDDSNFMINVIKSVLSETDDITVVSSAKTGEESIQKVKEFEPDCVTMDINMPGMSGVEAVKEIMRNNPIPIVMLSAHSTADATLTLQALANGALDFIQKPNGEISTCLESIKVELITKIRTAAKARVKKIFFHNYSSVIHKPSKNQILSDSCNNAEFIIGIGVSTGGPRLLKEIIPLFNSNINAALLISQHMPPEYTTRLAEQLNEATELTVVEAEYFMPIKEQHIYICPGGFNLTVNNKKIVLQKPSIDDIFVPSVDVMFKSIGPEYKTNCVGVVLTGMGSDGTLGLSSIKSNGGYIISQDESTSVIYGMPKAAKESGLVDDILPARLIPAKIQRWLNSKN